MHYDIAAGIGRKARTPHELLMVNLAAFHLLLAPAAIALGVKFPQIGAWWLMLTPIFSGIVIAYIYLRGRRAEHSDPWFVMAHWKLAWRRCRLLLIGYAVSAVMIGGGALIAVTSTTAMREIVLTIAIRLGVMPTVVIVLVLFVLANMALEQANKGEVPDGVVARYPAPQEAV